jgi:hypothetical protein
MIAYLASYPRSGNSLLQGVLRDNFDRLSGAVQAVAVDGPSYVEEVAKRVPEWEFSLASTPHRDWPDNVIWNERTAVYKPRFRRPGDRNLRRFVLAGPMPIELRETLAAESDLFLIKTHHLPYDRYFDGESVVQIVRHPGAALWSYFRYTVDLALKRGTGVLKKMPPPTLESVISGEVLFGSWSDYHLLWQATGEKLGTRFMQLRYEDTLSEVSDILQALSEFLKVCVEVDVGLRDYVAQRVDLMEDLRGTTEGYERYYSERQLEMVWERHKQVAESFGYGPPELAHVCPDEQVRRLSSLVEVLHATLRQNR